MVAGLDYYKHLRIAKECYLLSRSGKAYRLLRSKVSNIVEYCFVGDTRSMDQQISDRKIKEGDGRMFNYGDIVKIRKPAAGYSGNVPWIPDMDSILGLEVNLTAEQSEDLNAGRNIKLSEEYPMGLYWIHPQFLVVTKESENPVVEGDFKEGMKFMLSGRRSGTANRGPHTLTRSQANLLNSDKSFRFNGTSLDKHVMLIVDDDFKVNETRETTLAAGMKVRINKPDNLQQFPGWIPSMDQYNGVEFIYDTATVHNRNGDELISFRGCVLNTLWLAPVLQSTFAMDISKAKKFFDDGQGHMIYVFPPMKIPMKIIFAGHTKPELIHIPFPYFVVAIMRNNAYIMFLKGRPKIQNLAKSPLYWPPLPNLFPDGHMCIEFEGNEGIDITLATNKILDTVWVERELQLAGRPSDWPKSTVKNMYEFWSKQEKVTNVKWKPLVGYKSLDEFLRVIPGSDNSQPVGRIDETRVEEHNDDDQYEYDNEDDEEQGTM